MADSTLDAPAAMAATGGAALPPPSVQPAVQPAAAEAATAAAHPLPAVTAAQAPPPTAAPSAAAAAAAAAGPLLPSRPAPPPSPPAPPAPPAQLALALAPPPAAGGGSLAVRLAQAMAELHALVVSDHLARMNDRSRLAVVGVLGALAQLVARSERLAALAACFSELCADLAAKAGGVDAPLVECLRVVQEARARAARPAGRICRRRRRRRRRF